MTESQAGHNFVKTFFSSCDPIPPSAIEVVNRGRTEEEKIEILVGITRQAFSKCKDILKDGMTTDELNLAVACMSLIIRHDTIQEHESGKSVHCYCALSSHSPDAKRFKKSESDTVSSVRWYLDCSLRLFPDICSIKLNFGSTPCGKFRSGLSLSTTSKSCATI